MAGSIVASALPIGAEGDLARDELLVGSEAEYEATAIKLGKELKYLDTSTSATIDGHVDHNSLIPYRRGEGRLTDLRRMLWEGRWESRLFDTHRWVDQVETAYETAWAKWERGEGGDIWLK